MKRGRRDRVFVIANHQIRYDQLRVIDEHGDALGVMSRDEAVNQAFAADKDLVLVTDKADPPIAKIIEFSKYKYQLSQKKADERKKNRGQEVKEIRLRPFIDDNDLQAKIRKITDFIKKNHKVRLAMELRGRAITKQDLARDILNRITTELADIAQVEIAPKLLGKRLMMQIMPGRKKATAPPEPSTN
jgi:translation initiation factor IF-3